MEAAVRILMPSGRINRSIINSSLWTFYRTKIKVFLCISCIEFIVFFIEYSQELLQAIRQRPVLRGGNNNFTDESCEGNESTSDSANQNDN